MAYKRLRQRRNKQSIIPSGFRRWDDGRSHITRESVLRDMAALSDWAEANIPPHDCNGQRLKIGGRLW